LERDSVSAQAALSHSALPLLLLPPFVSCARFHCTAAVGVLSFGRMLCEKDVVRAMAICIC
jgi:hypothetical protein